MMNKRMYGYILKTGIALASLLYTGCAGMFQGSVFNDKPVTLQQLQQITRNQERRIKTLEGWAKITVKTPQQGFSADTHVLLKKPDSLFLKIEAAFGIDVGLFFADRSQYLMYTPIQNLSYTGSVDSLHNSPFIDLTITYEQLLRMISGSEQLAELSNIRIKQSPDEIILTGANRNNQYVYKFHPHYGNVEKLEITNADGDLLARHEYSRFARISGVTVPGHIKIVYPQRQEMFSLFYSEVRINKPIDKDRFAIKLPDSVLKINL